MHITRIKINDYKSYFKTPIIKLEKGINLIVGKNNVGKTALLEALTGKISTHSHLNEETKPRKNSTISFQKTQIIINILFEKNEIINIVRDESYKSLSKN